MEAMIRQGIIQSLCSFSHRKWLASMDIPLSDLKTVMGIFRFIKIAGFIHEWCYLTIKVK
jgi:hypothetical protein